MAYTQPQLPDFCRLRGRRYRDRWNQNKNRNDRNKSQRRRDLQRKMNEDSKRRSTNLTNEEKGILYDRDQIGIFFSEKPFFLSCVRSM